MFDCNADMRNSMYSRARNRGWRGQVRSALTGRSCRLFALAELDANCTVHARRHAGIRTVPIGQIRGSQDRSHDFDRDFNPLQEHSKGRWLGIAGARQGGKALPPVELVQVGDIYFVRDGHHRISVARALGQRDIEARVIVWHVTGLLPWKESAATHSLAGQRWREVESAGGHLDQLSEQRWRADEKKAHVGFRKCQEHERRQQMYLLQVELSRTIQTEKLEEAERCRRIQEALAGRQEQSAHLIQILVHLRDLIATIVTSSNRAVELVKS
jgi:hypothetical protein